MGCKPSKSAVREPRGLTEQGIGKIAGGHSSLAHSPPKPCGRTRMELDVFLKEAGYDATSPAYKAYFFKNRESTGKGCRYHRRNLDEDVDRCKECGCTIAEHHPAAMETGPPPSVPLMTWLHKHDCLGRGVKLSARTAVPLDPPESVRIVA